VNIKKGLLNSIKSSQFIENSIFSDLKIFVENMARKTALPF
jgi:hypothetical protein